MKKIEITFFVFLFMLNSALSQEYSQVFGNISNYEAGMTSFEKDPQAAAVIIYDIGESKFIDDQTGYNILFTRSRKIKVLSKAGIKYSEVSIPFYQDNKGGIEEVSAIEAFSYNSNSNGTIEKNELNAGTIYTEKINNNWNVKKFALPDVRPGTVIEYRYTVKSPFQFNLPGWEFQDRVPTVYSKYVVRMIPFYEYAFILQGISKFDQRTSIKDPTKRSFGAIAQVYGQNVGSGVEFYDLVHTFVLKNIPAFKDESYITSVSDYIMKMDFQLSKVILPQGGTSEIMSTWPLMITELLKEDTFGKYMNSCERQAKNVFQKEIQLTGKSDLEKCQIIINYVKSKYSWDGFNSKFTTKSAREFMNQKKGNPAEINLFMTALLNEAGIEASPVLISTRDNGKIRFEYPFLNFFNYVVVLVKVDNQVFLSDGADSYIQYNRIPPKCINEKGLIISNAGEKWVTLDLRYNSADQRTFYISVDPESLSLKTSMTIQASEFDSYWYKKSFSNDTMELKKYLTGKGFTRIDKISAINYDKNERPYIINFEGTAEAERLENRIIISPFLNFIPKINDLTQPTRSYPVDLTYSNTEIFKATINIPAGYKVISLPEKFKSESDLADLNLEFKESGGIVEAEASYRFKKAVYPPEEYSRIKGIKDLIIKKFNEPLIFEKI